MDKYKFKIRRDHAERLREYLDSSLNKFSYLKKRKKEMGEDWRFIEIIDDTVFVTNNSGKQLDSNYLRNFDILPKMLNGRENYGKKVNYWIKKILKKPAKMILKPIYPGLFTSSEEIYYKHYSSIWNNDSNAISMSEVLMKYNKPHYERLLAYNYYNTVFPYIRRLVETNKLKELRILEVGPGVGNLALVMQLYLKICQKKYYMIDLPEALAFSISHLMYQNPDSDFVLPHEFDIDLDRITNNKTYIFLTPDQNKEFPENYFDVGINTNSFAEMPYKEIEKYFSIYRRILKRNNLFFTVNRIEKATDLKNQQSISPKEASNKLYSNDDKSVEIKRFNEYPWSSKDHIYSYYVEPFNMKKTTNNFWVKIVKMNTCD